MIASLNTSEAPPIDEAARTVRGRSIRFATCGAGPVLVLLHGMGGCWQWWLEVMPELGKHHRVVAVDLPGFGDSEPLPGTFDLDAVADVLADLLDDLDVTRSVVAGHSMGGLAAISLTTRHPELVDRLVLVDAGGVPMSERRLNAILKLLRAAYWTFTRRRVLELLATNEAARVKLLRMAMRDPSSLSPQLAQIIMPKLAAPSFLDSIPASARAVRAVRPEDIQVPTLLLWGARDAFAPLHSAHAMLDRLPHGEIAVLSDVGHSPMIEAPRRFLDALIPFTTRNLDG